MEERCDQIMDCRDESDENYCKMIEFKDNYNKKVPPFTIEKKDHTLIPAKIRVSTQLMNVLAISEFSHTIDLKIGITLRWYENRVLYHNLKTQEALNVLNDEEVLASIQMAIEIVYYQLLTCVDQHDVDSIHYLQEH